ncbi:uncharacterized protein RCC_02497 [Ramularia collo-cygni]|uniref:Uncharacterized protein n=1 Tax=Ramularia collo-cygni TaxID=112498 RepID=A0A2D3UML6_9PEZI|nr:uncharacterized protein RCC_02497 [Ramularia collo-cygni]CZT16662.1 uncharacterized protein RCC_02497 [Ramularia collo-cygni]
MPRQVAPPPSGEFLIRIAKPFSGQAKHTVEVIGEPNRPASVRVLQTNGDEKVGDLPKDDVNELMSLVSAVRGFPSHATKDVYGLDTKLELNTFEIQWASDEEDSASNEIQEVGDETKDEFKRVVDSIEALGRQFAKNDSAI